MKLQLKRSNVLESGLAKEPTSAQLDYGELAVNYNNGDPVIFMKDSTDTVVRIAGAGAPGGGGGAGDGLEQIDNGDNTFDLAVQAQPSGGISVQSSGIAINAVTGGGVAVDASGIKVGGAGNGTEQVDNGDNTFDLAVKVKTSGAIEVDGTGIGITAAPGGGLAVSAAGISIGGNWSTFATLPE